MAAMVAWLVSEENSFHNGGGFRSEWWSSDLLSEAPCAACMVYTESAQSGQQMIATGNG